MKGTREVVCDVLEDMAGDILSTLGCHRFWGEVKIPECLLAQEEEKESNL